MPTLSMSAFGGKADLPDMLRPIFRDCGDFTATDRTLTAQLHTGCLGSFHFLFEFPGALGRLARAFASQPGGSLRGRGLSGALQAPRHHPWRDPIDYAH
jgi:hypothetical protein